MAKKPAKATKAKAPVVKIDETLNAKVAKCIGQGDLRKAARMVADANPPEVQFDKIMADNPNLREAFLGL